jgi:predicted phosphoadenosine phosphosulfate sulfurtransferase
MQSKILEYVKKWRGRGYFEDIPDEVPTALTQMGLAPSWKAIAIAILKNDHSMKSLGFEAGYSPWYSELKRVEIEARGGERQRRLF